MGCDKRIPAKERRPQAFAMWCSGDSQATIAERFGVTPQQISKDVNSHAETLPDVIGANSRIRRMLDEMDEVAAVLLADIRQRASSVGRLSSALMQLYDRQAKLLGLDKPGYRATEWETEGLDPININELEQAANEERHGQVDPSEWSTDKESDDGDTD